jgi:hypothetical protein
MRNNLFSRLTIPQQADILLKEGFYLDTREEPGFFVDMYLLHTWYIEIYFHKKQEDFVVIKTFYSSEDVEASSTAKSDILYPLPLCWSNGSYAC